MSVGGEVEIEGNEEAWSPEWVERFLRCNGCGCEGLERKPEGVVCPECGDRLRLAGPGLLLGLPQLPESEQETDREASDFDFTMERVRRFYEANPFPNYDGFESVGDLLSRASRSLYAAALDRQIPVGARVLEVGCGTGQLGAFLSIGGRSVVGADMTRASLELAGSFKHRQRLGNCNFLNASLFDLPLKPNAFDLVICKGVVHHTSDPRQGFRAICRHLRPGGYVILGLYNRIGRIPTTLRRIYFRLTRGNPKSADLVLRELAQSDEKARSWFLDQYAHPHETRHTIDQVLRWFDEEGIDYVSAAPPIRLREPFDCERALFEPADPGGRLEHWLVQLGWIFTISREGALFDVIGRKRGDPPQPEEGEAAS
jgi:SAM-dependent methyltransferase